MRIASWNVDSIRARLDHVLSWIDRRHPDVLCLQETKAGPLRFPRKPFESRGFEAVMSSSDGYGGVAVLSRPPIDDVVIGIPGAVPPLNDERSISFTCGALRIHTCYAPNGRKAGSRHHAIKLAWFELFRTWIELGLPTSTVTSVETGPVFHPHTMVIGDLNVAPADVDVWAPERYRRRNLTSPAERQAFEALIDLGLVDVVRSANPSDPCFTWWNRRGDFFDTDRGWRLDHALVDEALAPSVSAAWVDRKERAQPGASDHAPVVVDLSPIVD